MKSSVNCHVSAAGRFFYKKGGGVLQHKHDFDFQLQLIYEGDASEHCESDVFSVKPGDVVFVSQGKTHSFVAGNEGVKTLELKLQRPPNLAKLFMMRLTIFRCSLEAHPLQNRKLQPCTRALTSS